MVQRNTQKDLLENKIIKRTEKQKIGDYFEAEACRYLKQKGLRFVAKNQSCRQGEIDLIMRDNQVFVFVEVRYRKSQYFGGATMSVDYRKYRRLQNAAFYWLEQNGLNNHRIDTRFDLVAIEGSIENIQWYQNVFSG